MINFCLDKKNNVEAIICYKVDRLARDVEDFMRLVKLFKKHKIKLLFTNSSNLDNSFANFMLAFEAIIAQFEVENSGERIQGGNKKARLSGRHTHRLRGYEFRINANLKKQIYPNTDAKHIRKIF